MQIKSNSAALAGDSGPFQGLYKATGQPKDRKIQFKADSRSSRQTNMDTNRFSMLGDDDPGDKVAAAKATPKPPPISVKGLKMDDVMANVSKVPELTSEVFYTMGKGEIKVIPGSEEDFAKIKKHFSTVNVPYSTHPLKADRNVKVCLFGLPEMDIKYIKDALLQHQISSPHDIKMITPKNSNVDGPRIYVVFFKRSDGIKIETLRNITGMYNVRIRWDYYVAKKHSPTQCTRCQAFGHGSSNCNLPPKCVSCGDDHESKACINRTAPPHTDKSQPAPKAKTPDALIRCANCNSQHTANYSKCPVKLQYIQRTSIARNNSKVRVPDLNNKHGFPSLPTQRQSNVSYAPQNRRRTVADVIKEQQQQPNDSIGDVISALMQQQQRQLFDMMTSLMSTLMQQMEQMLSRILNVFSVQLKPEQNPNQKPEHD